MRYQPAQPCPDWGISEHVQMQIFRVSEELLNHKGGCSGVQKESREGVGEVGEMQGRQQGTVDLKSKTKKPTKIRGQIHFLDVVENNLSNKGSAKKSWNK